MALPQDPIMLMSYVNMKMRDGAYDSLSDFCASEGCDESELILILKEAGFDYIPSIKQFR